MALITTGFLLLSQGNHTFIIKPTSMTSKPLPFVVVGLTAAQAARHDQDGFKPKSGSRSKNKNSFKF